MLSYQVTSFAWFQGTGTTNTNSRAIQSPRVYTNCSKHLSTSKRPSEPRRTVKSLKQVHQEVVPPGKEWSLLTTKSQRSPTRMQSTAHYARGMGACRTPIIRVTARSTIWTVLQRKPLLGRGQSATHDMEACRASRKLTMCSCPLSL